MRSCTALLAPLLLFCCISWCQGAAEYYGKFIGPLKSYHHGVSGDVYAVDARTLHVRNFNYDGEGPVAYFYVGNTNVVNGNGHRLLDERGLGQPLKRYRRRHLTLTLPEGKTLANIKWFAVWCEEAAVNFGDVKIPKSLDFPRPQKLAQLSGVHAVSSEPVVVVDAQTLLIPSFSYDGEAPDAKFWVGRGSKPSPQGIRVPDENGKELPLRRYDRKTIVLTLPGDLTVFDIGHFGIWCEAFTVDFGHIQIPSGLNVPPSLKMLGVSPQKRSRSLQLSALEPSQQLQQEPSNIYKQNRDKNYNYQNVLPLFNPQETIRPTTYRPQLFVQPATIDPQSLRGADHRFSQKHTNGYLPLSQASQQVRHQPQYNTPAQQRSFPTPSVQIIPSVSLNDDNALLLQNQFDLGPLNQQVYLDPAYYNQQLQYDQFRNGNGQYPFLINVQDDQFAYQRPIRKGSDHPLVNSIPYRNTDTQVNREPKQLQRVREQNQIRRPSPNQVTARPNQPTQQTSLQSEPFQIPLISQGSGITVSSAILAEEFQQTFVVNQPQTRQTKVPAPQEFLTVPQFINDGLFSTDFGTVTPQVVRPVTTNSRVPNPGSVAAAQNIRPVSRPAPAPRTPARTIPAFTNNPQGSFSRFVLSSGSSIHDTLVKY